jgi:glycosyltransferase involved in cell wall biosynthesis
MDGRQQVGANIKKLSIIIPAFDEGATIEQVLERVYGVELMGAMEKEIVVVDDCSSDNTQGIVLDYAQKHPQLDLHYVRHERNMGKGAALRTGIKESTGEYLIVQDADLEYDPNEYNVLLRPVLQGVADVVYGSRFTGGGSHRVLLFWHTIGNRLLTLLSNMFTDLNLTDVETCYKLVRSDIIKGIDLKEDRFGVEPEITAKIARIPGIRIYEVGISYYGRTYAEGKKVNWKDGLWAMYCVLKYNSFAK